MPFPGRAVSAQGPDGYPATAVGGYQVTLTNTASAAADVDGFSVAFYSGGAESGCGSIYTADEFITPGQALTWTETTTIMDAGQTGAVDCRRHAHWSSGHTRERPQREGRPCETTDGAGEAPAGADHQGHRIGARSIRRATGTHQARARHPRLAYAPPSAD